MTTKKEAIENALDLIRKVNDLAEEIGREDLKVIETGYMRKVLRASTKKYIQTYHILVLDKFNYLKYLKEAVS